MQRPWGFKALRLGLFIGFVGKMVRSAKNADDCLAMPESRDDEQYSEAETEQRVQKILQGAFAGAPTPLKDVPKRGGDIRAPRTKRHTSEEHNKAASEPVRR